MMTDQAIVDDSGLHLPQSGRGKFPNTSESGVSGTLIRDGFLYDEPNVNLRDERGLLVLQQMGYDPTVAAAVSTPVDVLRSTKWFVTPFSDDPDHLAQAAFIHHCFWQFGNQSYDDYIRQMLHASMQYGHGCSSRVLMPISQGEWAGKWGLFKMAYRSPLSLYRFIVDGVADPSGNVHRELVKIIQRDPVTGRLYDLWMDECVLLCHNRLGENFRGTSLIRPSYRPWKSKDGLIKIQLTGLERNYMGILRATLPAEFSRQQQLGAEAIVRNHRTHANAGIVTTEDVAIEVLDLKVADTAMQHALDFYDTQILMGSRLGFLKLGTGGDVGSWALSEDHSELYLMAFNGVANQWEQLNNLPPIIPDLIRLNFPNADMSKLPRLEHGDIGQRQIDKLGRVLAAVGATGFVTPDPALENKLRDYMGLPELDEALRPEALKPLAQQLLTEDFLSKAQRDAANADEEAKALQKMATAPAPAQSFAEARARMTWGRPRSRGGRVDPQDRPRVRAAELLVEWFAEQESTRRTMTPEDPRIVAARRRRPYVVRAAEDAVSHHTKVESTTAPSRLVAQRHAGRIGAILRRVGVTEEKAATT